MPSTKNLSHFPSNEEQNSSQSISKFNQDSNLKTSIQNIILNEGFYLLFQGCPIE